MDIWCTNCGQYDCAASTVMTKAACRSMLDLMAAQCQNFALTDDAVIFFFGEGQVIPDNSGPHQISVPRTEMAPLMA